MWLYMQGKSFFSLLDVDKYGGHMVKVRRFRDIICDNMSRTYVYALIYTHICVYAYTHIYGCLQIWARQTVLPLLQITHYLGHMVILWRFSAHVLRIYIYIYTHIYDNMCLIYDYLLQGNLRCLCRIWTLSWAYGHWPMICAADIRVHLML